MVVVFFLAALLATPTRSSSPSSNAAGLQPTLTFCSGHSPNLTSSPAGLAVTSSEVSRFLAAVCAGAYGVTHMSHNMSAYVVENRTMYGVARAVPPRRLGLRLRRLPRCFLQAHRRDGVRGVSGLARRLLPPLLGPRRPGSIPRGRVHDDRVQREPRAVAARGRQSGSEAPPRRRGEQHDEQPLVPERRCRHWDCGRRRLDLRTHAVRRRGLVRRLLPLPPRRSRGGGQAVQRQRRDAGPAAQLHGQVRELPILQNQVDGPQRQCYWVPTTGPVCYIVVSPPPGGRNPPPPSPPAQAPSPWPAPTPAVPAPPGGRNPPPPSPPAQARAPPPPASTVGFPPRAAQPTPAPPGGHTPQRRAAAPNDQTATGSSNTKGKGMSNTSKWLIVSLATGLVIAAIILALTIWYRRKRRPAQREHVIDGMLEETMHDQEKKHLSREEDEEDDGGRTTCQLYSYQVLEAATCHFSSRNKLGSGGFGTVYKGTLEDGKEVAVKSLRDSKRTIQELEREISIVADLRHKNLVRFLGYCFQEEGRFLIYEYVPNNSLDKFWYKASFQCEKLEWVTWFNIILGVARGLWFLHNKGIIHRDLKPHNVLLDDNFNPKIADFDLMRMYDKQKTHETTEKVAGTFGYMAPECTSGRKFLLSFKSDVYSYGVLVLEIITGHKIYTFEGQHSEGLVEYVWQHWTEKRASDVVDGDLGVEGQQHAARQALRCVHVALLCVQSDRARRPTMGQVIAMLSSDDGAAEELPEPSLPGYVVRPTAASGAQLCFGCR